MLIDKELLDNINDSYYENGFVLIKDFIDPNTLNFIQISTSLMFDPNTRYKELFLEDGDDPTLPVEGKSIAAYSSLLGETMLASFTSKYSHLIRKNLVPTYSFLRSYDLNGVLAAHTDRPACQYSMTVPLNKNAADWPFFVQDYKNNKEPVEIKCDLGDAILYMGERVKHWREKNSVGPSIHAFLHYVDSNDPEYKEHFFDKRPGLGYLKT